MGARRGGETDQQNVIIHKVYWYAKQYSQACCKEFSWGGGRGGGMGEAGVYFKNRGQIINVEMIGHASSKSLGSENFEI